MPVNSFAEYPMSWTPDIRRASGPLYKTIAEQLEADIKSGRLTPGTKLPPQRELADFLDINVSTISRAFKLCDQKGLICATVGNGTFVASDAAANSYLLHAASDAGLIEMGSVFCETAVHEEVVQQMKKMIGEPDFGKLFRYGRSGGTDWQKETAAKLMRKAGYPANAQELLLAGGAQNAISAILAGLFQPGDRIATNEFIYPGLKTAANMLGIRLIPLQQADNELTAAALRYACKQDKINGLYLIPDYHNPTTHTMSETSRRAVAEVAKEERLIVIEDAMHSLLSESPAAIAAHAPEQVLYISSLSKTIAPGLRIAFVAVPQQYRTRLTAALYNLNISVPPLMAELATRMIVSGALDAILDKQRDRNRQRNAIVDRYLQGFELFGKPEGIFRWLRLPPQVSGEQFETLAYYSGVRVYGAERFAVGNAKAVNAVRLAIVAPESDAQLEQAMKILHDLLVGLKNN